MSHVRVVPATDEFWPAWTLRDGGGPHGHAAHLPTVHALVNELAVRLPEHATLIRLIARRTMGDDVIAGDVS